MPDIFFKSEEHKERFSSDVQELDKVYRGKIDREYGAALYILSSSQSLIDKTTGYISIRGIRFGDMLESVDFSGGQVVLVKLAANLFNSSQHIDPIELMWLDEGNYKVAMQSIVIRRSGLRVGEI
jgi:hypothetical protein